MKWRSKNWLNFGSRPRWIRIWEFSKDSSTTRDMAFFPQIGAYLWKITDSIFIKKIYHRCIFGQGNPINIVNHRDRDSGSGLWIRTLDVARIYLRGGRLRYPSALVTSCYDSSFAFTGESDSDQCPAMGTRRKWPRPRREVGTSGGRDVETKTTTLPASPLRCHYHRHIRMCLEQR